MEQAKAVYVLCAARSKGWKETNFQVLKKYMETLKAAVVATKPSFPAACAHDAIPGLVPKMGDIKVKAALDDALTALAQHVGVNFVALRVMKEARAQKSPKVQSDAVAWVSSTLRDFGMLIATKPLLAFMREMMVRRPTSAARPRTRPSGLLLATASADPPSWTPTRFPEPDQPDRARRGP